MKDFNEKSVLDLELRAMLVSLEQGNALSRVRLPGREAPQIGLDDEIMVTVVTDPDEHEQVIKSLRSKKSISVSGKKGLLLATLPMRALREVEKLPGIESVAIPEDLLLPRLKHARAEIGLTEAVRRNTGGENAKPLTGRNVVIATVDSGIDWWHGDFRHADGRTRIARYAWWGEDSARPGLQTWRTEPQHVYDADDINKALNGSQYIMHRDPRGHGTHCMSIAAGNGRASEGGNFQGIAPEATIMALGTTRYSAERVKWGIENFFELADDQPAVMSLSYGTHQGAHDGTSWVEKTIERQSGEGRIVVVAAGNEAEDGIHWQGEISANEDTVIPVRIGDNHLQWVDIWISAAPDEVEVLVETPDRVRYPHTLLDPTSTVFGELSFNKEMKNEQAHVFLKVENGRVNHVLRIRIRGAQGVSGQIHAWSGTNDPSTTAHLFLGAPSNEYTVGIPATVEEAIVVGSFISQTKVRTLGEDMQATLRAGDLSPFSSHGPTRTGLWKPDIVAPGQYIIAALASDSVMATEDRFRPRHHKTGPYLALQGTSMATPLVAGIIALMLQRCNKLTPKDVRELLTKSARKPEELDPSEWHPGFGFGLLNAEELFKRLECR